MPASSSAEEPLSGTDQYKNIVEGYKKTELIPLRRASELPTFMRLIGSDLEGDKSVCDLACGEGFYTRLLRQMTSGRVVGADISENMIKLAKSQEDPGDSLKIEYYHDDACKSHFQEKFGESFDVVNSALFLHYAESKEILDSFVRNAYCLLKPGGRFIGLNRNPYVNNQETLDKGSKYCLTTTTDVAPIKEGDVLHTCLTPPGGNSVKFDNYYWAVETYEASFAKAGFEQVKWIKLGLSEDSDKEFWQDWLDNCPLIFFSAIKPRGD